MPTTRNPKTAAAKKPTHKKHTQKTLTKKPTRNTTASLHIADHTVLLGVIAEAGKNLNITRECLEDLLRDALVNPHPFTSQLEELLAQLTAQRGALRNLYLQIKHTKTHE